MATFKSSVALSQPQTGIAPQSTIRVLPLDSNDHARWDSFALCHPDGTFFHQTSWMRVIAATYGYRPYYFLAERDGRIVGIAPAFLVSSWLSGPCLISLPFAVYGGVCAVDSESEDALIAHLEDFANKQEIQYLELRNRKGEVRPGYHSNPRYATFTIPLEPDAEKVYSAFPKDIRYMIRKGDKAGLRVRRGMDQLDSFYRLMAINLRRLGTPAFPRSLFVNLAQEYGNQVELTLVYSGDKPVAGAMSFRFRDWLQPYYFGSLDEAKGLAANNFLWWKLIEHAAETGCAIFDFGRSKKGSGNFDFKKKWNPHIETLNYQVRLVRRTEVPNFSPTNPKFEMATNIWKKLPLGLTKVIGPRVVRWFP
jgi:FemAB-related protein (PEP-CTERM system-associated)